MVLTERKLGTMPRMRWVCWGCCEVDAGACVGAGTEGSGAEGRAAGVVTSAIASSDWAGCSDWAWAGCAAIEKRQAISMQAGRAHDGRAMEAWLRDDGRGWGKDRMKFTYIGLWKRQYGFVIGDCGGL